MTNRRRKARGDYPLGLTATNVRFAVAIGMIVLALRRAAFDAVVEVPPAMESFQAAIG